ncbi:hypothetical protein RRG08_038574 [Elysia crispata]|uniref:Uncharacterized protein n=1 Tax=Elysia crispata TaxID=231223 RepID=A0AAE1CYK8_9GAST|nr:hypothetical protein RRG08_038574 [Elysia crispata]
MIPALGESLIYSPSVSAYGEKCAPNCHFMVQIMCASQRSFQRIVEEFFPRLEPCSPELARNQPSSYSHSDQECHPAGRRPLGIPASSLWSINASGHDIAKVKVTLGLQDATAPNIGG